MFKEFKSYMSALIFFTEFLKLFSNTLPGKLIIVFQKFYITGPLYKECPPSPDLGLGIII